MMFKKLETNIDDIPTSETVGPIELFTGWCSLVKLLYYSRFVDVLTAQFLLYIKCVPLM